MSEEPTRRVPGPDGESNGAEGFAVAEEIARSEALAEASTAPAHDAQDAPAAEHAAVADHGDGHGHGAPALGPIDWTAYGAGVVGAVLGLAVAVVLAFTTGYIVL